jgi:hypothetical protein
MAIMLVAEDNMSRTSLCKPFISEISWFLNFDLTQPIFTFFYWKKSYVPEGLKCLIPDSDSWNNLSQPQWLLPAVLNFPLFSSITVAGKDLTQLSSTVLATKTLKMDKKHVKFHFKFITLYLK